MQDNSNPTHIFIPLSHMSSFLTNCYYNYITSCISIVFLGVFCRMFFLHLQLPKHLSKKVAQLYQFTITYPFINDGCLTVTTLFSYVTALLKTIFFISPPTYIRLYCCSFNYFFINQDYYLCVIKIQYFLKSQRLYQLQLWFVFLAGLNCLTLNQFFSICFTASSGIRARDFPYENHFVQPKDS